MGMNRYAQGVRHASDGWQCEARKSGAQDHGRNHDMQPVEATGGEEMRHGPRAALDQHAPQPAHRQGIEDRRRVEKRPGRGQGDRLDVVRGLRPRPFERDDDAARTISGKDARAAAQGAPRIDHHAHRIWTHDTTDGELRIIGAHSAGADDDGIDDGAQAMQMIEPCRSVYVVGMAGKRGNTPVERLTDLTNHHGAGGRACPQGAEQLLPCPRQHVSGPYSMRNFGPRRGGVGGPTLHQPCPCIA